MAGSKQSEQPHLETKERGAACTPYVPSAANMPEFTLKAVLLGIGFGIVFGAANAYLGLVAGLTISTSIPVAVMTVAAFRLMRGLGGKGSILEANMSQTVGSASSSLASGIIFTLPALFLWNLNPQLLQMVLLAICGGLIGVLFMIPLRKFLIEKEHGVLPYPEGTACAEVLVASDVGGAKATNVFLGLGIGAIFKLMVNGLNIVPDKVTVAIPFLNKGELGCKVSAALLGVGYILGLRIALTMAGGGLLSWLVIIPGISYWGSGQNIPMYPETTLLLDDMSPSMIWSRYVRYIGAGAVAAGGLITLVRSIPTIIASIKVGTSKLRERILGKIEVVPRTQRDLPMKLVGISLVCVLLLMVFVSSIFPVLANPLQRAIAGILVVVCGFFFVTVSARIVGLVGVTSNPTSGMTIATLLLTASVFLVLGWSGDKGKAAAITIGCVVAIAVSIAGDTSQDLKTGFLLGATPRKQQIGELIGVLTSAIFVCLTVIFLHNAYGFGTAALPAPQATLMKVVVEGVLDQNLPWLFVGSGVAIALTCELCRLPSLPFAVGVYLPVSTMMPVLLGGLIRHMAERRAATSNIANAQTEKGILLGSGLVGGEGLVGVGIAGAAVILKYVPEGIGYGWCGAWAPILGVVAMCFLVFVFWRKIKKHNAV